MAKLAKSTMSDLDKLIVIKSKCVNEEYLENLLGTVDGWHNVPIMYWINIDNRMWDIRILIKLITSQLNQSESENPYPKYPENPFNRIKFSVIDLKKIKQRLSILKRCGCDETNNYLIDRFLSINCKKLQSLYTMTDRYNVSQFIIKSLLSYMRYKIINNKNSQGGYNGCWVKKDEPISEFEMYHDIIKKSVIEYNGQKIFIDDTRYRLALSKLQSLEQECSVY